MTLTSNPHDLQHLYLVSLGSNQRHALLGSPAAILEQAFAALEMEDVSVFAVSRILTSRPIGPSQRQFANAAAILLSPIAPDDLLVRLKTLEAHFGRRAVGQKWRARVLDLDIILWSGGIWSSDSPPLAIPHPLLQSRAFVLQPASEIAPDWRDPVSGLRIRQLFSQLIRPKPLDPNAPAH